MGESDMGLDIWSRDDIRNILIGLRLSGLHRVSLDSAAETRAFCEGFQIALEATAASFGVCLQDEPMCQVRQIRSEGSPMWSYPVQSTQDIGIRLLPYSDNRADQSTVVP